MITQCLLGKPTAEDMREVERFGSYLQLIGEFRKRGRSEMRSTKLALRAIYGSAEYHEMMRPLERAK